MFVKNAVIAAVCFVVLGLLIVLAQKQWGEAIPRPREDSPNNAGQTPTDDEVKRLVLAGQKIEAIKLYREIHQGGLKEAKDAVDKIARGQGGSMA